MSTTHPQTLWGGKLEILDSPVVQVNGLKQSAFSGVAKRSFADTTNTQNAGRYDSALPTGLGSGELSAECDFIPGDAGQQEILTVLKSATLKNYKLTSEDGGSWTFAAYVESADVTGLDLKKVIGFNIKLKIQGETTYTAAA